MSCGWSSAPRSLPRRVLLTTAVVSALFVTTPAFAEFERLALRYESSETCPAESEFVATIEAYTKRWSRARDEASATLNIHVQLSPGPVESVGKLTVTAPGGASTEREIAGPSCAEVSHALAVMVAVALDARSGTVLDAKEEPAPPDALPDASPRAKPPMPVGESAPPLLEKQRPPGDSLRVRLDLRAETTSAVVRGGIVGVGASLAVSPTSSSGSVYLSRWKPAIGIGIRQSFPHERTLPRGKAELLWTAANLRLCPFELAIGERLEISPCAEMNGGVLRASASGFPGARSVSTLWLDLGGAVWASVALSKTFFLSSTVLVTMPLNRQPFTTDSGARVASVPPLGVLGGVGLGVRM